MERYKLLHSGFLKLLFILLTSVLVSSCKTSHCVYSHDFGEVSSGYVNITENNSDINTLSEYTNTGYRLEAGTEFSFSSNSPEPGKVVLLFYNEKSALDSTKITTASLEFDESRLSPDYISQLYIGIVDSTDPDIRINFKLEDTSTLGTELIIDNAINPLKDYLMGKRDPITNSRDGGAVKFIYEGITFNEKFTLGIRALLSLMIITVSLSYMLGLSNIDINEVIMVAFRFTIIIILISPQSWEFFYQYLLITFVDTVDWLIWVMSRQFTEVISSNVIQSLGSSYEPVITNVDEARSETFRFISQTISVFFSDSSNAKMQGLFFSRAIGFFYVFIIYMAVFIFLFAVGKALIIYLSSIIIVAMLLILAPIFISFIMFKITRGMFRTWIDQLVSYSLQPVILFMVLALFNALVFSSFYQVSLFSVCFGCVHPKIDLGILGSEVCIIHGYTIDNNAGISPESKMSNSPVGIFLIFIFYFMVNLFNKLTSWATQMSSSLVSGDSADLSAVADQAVKDLTDGGKVDRKEAQRRSDTADPGGDDPTNNQDDTVNR